MITLVTTRKSSSAFLSYLIIGISVFTIVFSLVLGLKFSTNAQ